MQVFNCVTISDKISELLEFCNELCNDLNQFSDISINCIFNFNYITFVGKNDRYFNIETKNIASCIKDTNHYKELYRQLYDFGIACQYFD